MTTLLIVIAITLLVLVTWLLLQPKQGTTASNSPRSTLPDGLPAGEVSAAGQKHIVPQDKAMLSTPPPLLEPEIEPIRHSDPENFAIKQGREIKPLGQEDKDFAHAPERDESLPISPPQINSEPTLALRKEVERLLASHQKVSAVKLVRDATHWHLREAKEYVDAIQDEEFQSMDRVVSNMLPNQALREEIQRLVMTDQRFAAVERVRSATGWALSKAMDYVNRVERDQSSP